MSLLVPTNCKGFLMHIGVHTVQMQWSSEHTNDWCSMGSSLLRQLKVRSENNWGAGVCCSNNNVKCFYFYRPSFSVEHLLKKLCLLVSQTIILFKWHVPCNTEEIDYCLLLYALDVSKGFDRILIKTIDRDTVISKILINMDQAWQMKSISFILVHDVWCGIAFRATYFNWTDFFHALSECNAILAISGIRKIGFWDTWKLM